MGPAPSKPQITQSKLDSDRRAIEIDNKNLSINVPIRDKNYNKLLSDIKLYFKALAHYQDDVILYQLQGLVDVEEYLNLLKEQIDEYKIELDDKHDNSLPRLSELNKKDIEEMYNYIYIYTYLLNSTEGEKLKPAIDRILKKIKV